MYAKRGIKLSYVQDGGSRILTVAVVMGEANLYMEDDSQIARETETVKDELT